MVETVAFVSAPGLPPSIGGGRTGHDLRLRDKGGTLVCIGTSSNVHVVTINQRFSIIQYYFSFANTI